MPLGINNTIKTLGFLVSVFLSACNPSGNTQTTPKLEYQFIDFDVEDISIDNKAIDYSEEKENDSIYNLKYCVLENNTKKSCYSYRLVNSDNAKDYKYINEDGDISDLYLENSKNYSLNGKSFKIYKFILNSHVTDGKSIHFWSPEFGVLIVKSSTWRSFKQLVNLNNGTKSQEVAALLGIIYNDSSFYNDLVKKERLDTSYSEIEEELSETYK